MAKLTKVERIALRQAHRELVQEATRQVRRAVRKARSRLKADFDPLKLYERGPESTGVRIVYSVADDGHAPLQDYCDPYLRAMEAGPYPGGVTGFEYRPTDETGQLVPHDYSIVLCAAVVPSTDAPSAISWAYIPVADEIVTKAKMEADGVTPKLDNDGNIKYKDPEVTVAANPVIDAMLDAMLARGLIYAYWTSLDALQSDTSDMAMEVKAAWPLEWIVDGERTMLVLT